MVRFKDIMGKGKVCENDTIMGPNVKKVLLLLRENYKQEDTVVLLEIQFAVISRKN